MLSVSGRQARGVPAGRASWILAPLLPVALEGAWDLKGIYVYV